MLAIESPTGFTHKINAWLKQELDALKLEYTQTKKGAYIAKIKGKTSQNSKVIAAHVDTLGAIVCAIKPNGRLKLRPIGGLSWGACEGENVLIHTFDGNRIDGSLMPVKASRHVYQDQVTTLPRDDDNAEIRIDEITQSAAETRALGIEVGNYISFDPRLNILDNGFIKARYLDDKVCVALLLAWTKELLNSKQTLATDTYLYFANYEEVGHGISFIPEDVEEVIAIDVGLCAPDANGDERKVNIVVKDASSPYDYDSTLKLINTAKKHNIPYTTEVPKSYSSDASLIVKQGRDYKFTCFGPSVDASHHYERTHIEGIRATLDLLALYCQ